MTEPGPTPTPTAPPPRLRPAGGVDGHGGGARVGPSTAGAATPAGSRAVPVRLVLLLGLAVLVLLAAVEAGGAAAVLGVALALVLPGAVVQPRFLPGLRTDPVTIWCLRCALSLAAWSLTALAVGAAGIPVRSVWTVVVGAVLLAAVVVGDPDAGGRFGTTAVRQLWWGLLALALAAALAFGARGLVAIASDPTGGRGAAPVVVGFADPSVPVALAATGAGARVDVTLTNAGSDTVEIAVTAVVGRGLPWTPVSTEVPAGATRTVTIQGSVAVCTDPQQVLVTVDGVGPVTPLSAVIPGHAGSVSCGAG